MRLAKKWKKFYLPDLFSIKIKSKKGGLKIKLKGKKGKKAKKGGKKLKIKVKGKGKKGKKSKKGGKLKIKVKGKKGKKAKKGGKHKIKISLKHKGKKGGKKGPYFKVEQIDYKVTMKTDQACQAALAPTVQLMMSKDLTFSSKPFKFLNTLVKHLGTMRL